MNDALEFSADELNMLNNCLNELCNGVRIEDWEFQTRIGWTRAEVRELLDKINMRLPAVRR
ncbi:hypothetical protein [Sphingomonas lenta]|uniref:Uncharacterized protein n=1 Tax=Sphingomonas lenta TaxID=1141887 RepID=A0A2A2SG53_9SPHN|nr:hypothetical protein [Sphingomonas lenta]PAX08183.1 hypothetical protein CKY28_11440 [Sphingomonas lenta]